MKRHFAYLVVLLGIIVCGCAGLSPSPTIVPTILPTPIPSVTTAPPTITPIKSLATGTQILWKLQGGYGQLAIKNRLTGEDAVVILASADDPKNALIAVYVKGGQDCTVEGITDGKYVLYDMIGINWDDAAKAFAHTTEYARSGSTLNYYTTDTESKVYTFTLSRPGTGDAQSQPLNPADMPSLQ